MEIIRGDELAERFDELVERVASDERIIITCGGKQVAIVSFDDLEFLEDVDRKLDQSDAKNRDDCWLIPLKYPSILCPRHLHPTASSTGGR